MFRNAVKMLPKMGKGKLALFTAGTTLAATGVMSKLSGGDDKNKLGGDNVPGDKERVKSMIGENMANAMQNFDPLKSFETHIQSFKCYSKNTDRQLPVHEYISHINEDVMQAIVMDSDRKDAKVIGVEYIITKKLFDQLPAEERKLWSFKGYEVSSGAMVAPRMPMKMEHKLMADLAPTYGKSFALWQVDKYNLPLGAPQLLIALPREDSVKPQLIKERDRMLGIDTKKEIEDRKDIKLPKIASGVNRGEAISFQVVAK